jgi:23S rRNA pseudouridine2604 synthase
MLTKELAIRLNKLVAARIPCSRKEAEVYIAEGLVKMNGVVADSPGAKFPTNALLELDLPKIERSTAQKVTIMLNKPLGYVSTQPEVGKEPAVKLLTAPNELNYQAKNKNKKQDSTRTTTTTNNNNNNKQRLPEPYTLSKMAVAGRLDINTTGLLLFTQCGSTAAQIIGNDNNLEKEYLVRLKDHDSLTGDYANVQSRLEQLRHGVMDDGQWLEAKTVVVQNDDQLLMTLTSGKRHQIRRMVRAVGWHIQAIKRTRIGHLCLGSLPLGQWRYVDVARELFGGGGNDVGDAGGGKNKNHRGGPVVATTGTATTSTTTRSRPPTTTTNESGTKKKKKKNATHQHQQEQRSS